MRCPDEHVLADFARGELDVVARDRVESHIDCCEICGRVVAELLRVYGTSDRRESADALGHSGEPTLRDMTQDQDPAQRSDAGELAEGARLGRYVVLRRVGAGGMGVVYAAYDPELDRKLAVKLLRADAGSADTDDSRSQRNRRLLREAQAMARLTHPNVVTVHDVGTFEGQVFVAMEFVDGGTLTAWLGRSRRAWRETLEVFRRAGQGLAAAHEAGLVHRDFKPDNVLLSSTGRVVVTDLGLARPSGGNGEIDASTEEASISESSALVETLTRSGALVGTPAYMAPEQLGGRRADHRSDQFSFCVALYEALFGQRPFEGTSLGALVASVLEGRVRPAPADARVPRWLRRAVLQGLAVDPADRFADMHALLVALRPPARAMRLGAAALVVGAIAVGSSAALSSSPAPTYCERADELLAGVWDEQAKVAVAKAFTSTKLPFADDAAAIVEHRVDEYAASWLDAQTTACEAELAGRESAGVLALRMACLSSRRDALATLVGLLREADADLVVRAADAIDSLPPVRACEDAGALGRGPPAPPGETAQDVAAIRRLIVESTVLESAGKIEEASTLSQKALARARNGSYGPVLAEALFESAETLAASGKPREAEPVAHEALTTALAHEHMRVVAEASWHLAYLAVNRADPPPHAERWVAIGRAAVRAHGKAPRVEAGLTSVLGTALRQQERFEESVAVLEESLELWKQAVGEDDWALADPLSSLGLSLSRLGRHDEAARHLERARELLEHKYGRDHPGYAAAMQNFGVAYYVQGAYGSALKLYREALETLETSLGEQHRNVGVTAYSVATALLMLGRYDEALDHAERSRAINVETHGEQSVPVATDLSLIGEIHLRAGRRDRAEATLRKALELLDASAPEEQRRRAFFQSQLGRVLFERGDLGRARRELETALATHERIDADSEYVAETLAHLAELYLDGHDDPDTARPLAERSLQLYDDVPTNPQVKAEARFRLARVLWATARPDDRARAHALATEAARMLAPLETDPSRARAIEDWLAEHDIESE